MYLLHIENEKYFIFIIYCFHVVFMVILWKCDYVNIYFNVFIVFIYKFNYYTIKKW